MRITEKHSRYCRKYNFTEAKMRLIYTEGNSRTLMPTLSPGLGLLVEGKKRETKWVQ